MGHTSTRHELEPLAKSRGASSFDSNATSTVSRTPPSLPLSTRTLSWQHAVLPAEASSSAFGELLRAEAARTAAERMAPISEALAPLTTLLKRTLWHFVANERRLFAKSSVVLRVYRLPKASDALDVPPLIDLNKTRIKTARWTHVSVAELLPSSPILQQYVKRIEHERASVLAHMRREAATTNDPDELLLARASPDGSDLAPELVAAIDEQIDAAHAAMTAAAALAREFAAATRFSGDMLGMALSRDVGLPITVTAAARYWYAREDPQQWKLENGLRVEVFADLKPTRRACSPDASSTLGSLGRHVWTQQGFDIKISLAGFPGV